MGKLSEEDIKKMASEKAEKSASHDAFISQQVTFLPMVLIACILAVAGAPISVYMSVSVVGLLASLVAHFITKRNSVKKYYQEYLSEMTTSTRGDEKDEG